ncbi:MAG: hypothetical protein R2911_14130 [Caldilineaceae bacterium]
MTGAGFLPARTLHTLNAQMYRPLQHALSRPIQRSFPHLNGLFWLLHASGLAFVNHAGKKAALQIHDDVYASWQVLNPTEQYCTLLEAWLLRAALELIGERSMFGYNRVLPEWRDLFARIPDNGWNFDDSSSDDHGLHYFPGYHNLALLELFGFVEVAPADVMEGKGWRFSAVRRTQLGNAILGLLAPKILGAPDSDDEPLMYSDDLYEIGLLQPVLQPYISGWQKNLVIPEVGFRDGLFIYKVILLDDVWRRVAIPAQEVLDELAELILRAFAFDNDHLYRFIYHNHFGAEIEINHPYMEEPPFTPEVQVGAVPVAIGETLLFNFDFGDNWIFELLFERIDEPARGQKAAILESVGEAPEQYPDYYEDEEAFEW